MTQYNIIQLQFFPTLMYFSMHSFLIKKFINTMRTKNYYSFFISVLSKKRFLLKYFGLQILMVLCKVDYVNCHNNSVLALIILKFIFVHLEIYGIFQLQESFIRKNSNYYFNNYNVYKYRFIVFQFYHHFLNYFYRRF